MSYLVLARKWRPQAFADMTGQEHVVRTLSNAIAQGRVAHAFLFCGPRGVGKTTAARLLARALNCEKGPTAEPCGTCRPCQEIVAGTSVDVAEIDGASNNGVEDVRQIRERVTYLPQRDRHKIYIIDEVHMLTTAAFNALLKTLEEPPPHVKFIFATTEPHKLPDTILSRCQRHNFRRIATPRMIERLAQIATAEGATISERSLSLIVRQSEGGMRDALSLLDMVLSACGREASDEAVAEALGAVDRSAVHEICQALIRRDAKPVLARIEDLHSRGADFKRLAEELAIYLRHLLVARSVGEAPAELADSERKAVSELAAEADPAQLARLFDFVHGGIWEISRASQPRLAMEVALLKCIHLAPGAPIGELLARVESLAAQLADPNPASASSTPAAPGGRPGSSPFRDELSSAESPSPVRPTPAPQSPRGSGPGPTLALAGAVDAEERAAPAPPRLHAVPAPPPPAAAEVEAPGQVWRQLVSELRAQKKELLAQALAHARVLSMTPAQVRLGFSVEDGLFRRQVERQQNEARALLERALGAAPVFVYETVCSEEAVQSIAAEESEQLRAREERILRESREAPQVLAAMKILGGSIEQIRILEEDERESPDFGTAAADEAEDSEG